MSKPIINGIDVSECKYLNKVVNEEPYCNMDEEHPYICSSDENCYFKQLKRTQREIEKYSTINEQLQKKFNDYQDRKIEENANLMKRLDIADKKLTVFSRELEQANKENENLKEEIAISREFLNQYQEEANALKSYETYKVWLNNKYRKENENLKQQLKIDKKQINYFIEENQKLKKTLQELEDLSLKTYDVADFQMYFDKLRGKNDD